MKRRDVLKGMGLTAGYMIATPSLLSLLQSCTSDVKSAWNPQFFSVDEKNVMEHLVNLILPSSDKLPGALDVNVPQFIDAYANEVASKEQQDQYKKGMNAVMKELGSSATHYSEKNYDALLAKYLKANSKALETIKSNENANLVLNTLYNLRSISIWAYKTSKKVGTEVLVYDPIPGVFNGCMPLQEATGGRAWSLQ